jgi:formylglycine-generating enzyme required for sulfatase activity/energy-coupling factor transporter ATP-binding protein EcfA2
MHDRLERLRRKLDATDDPDDRADLAAAIHALEQAARVAPQPQENARDAITVGNLSQVTGVAIGTDARATVYIDGRQGKTSDELLAAYYERLASRCRSMPLQGIYEQRSTGDSLTIGLEQVYMQLATTARVRRERIAGVALKDFDAEHYLAIHTGDKLLPAEQRDSFQPLGLGAQGLHVPMHIGDEPRSLSLFNARELAGFVPQVQELVFLGPQLVSEAMAEASHLVLLGEPGSGKSTALRYLSYVLASAGLDPQLDLAAYLPGWTLGRLLPIFAPLLPLAKQFADHPTTQGEATDLWAYLADHLQPKGANPGLGAAVHEELEAGRVILLLDGLDEVAGAGSRRKIVRAVQSFAERYPTCRIVVACRVRAYEGERNAAWQLSGWPTATLADWTLGQMQAFVKAWYDTVAALRSRTDTWRGERIAGLSRAISTREDLQRFGRQPLMLTVMALVHLNDGRLPEERASLYGRCIDILLGQWEIAGKEASVYGTLMDYIDLPDTDVTSLRPLLGKAAYEAHRAATAGEVGRLSRAVLRTIVDDELKRRRHPNPSDGADRFLEYTDLRAGLIQASDAGDEYSFPHQTFQEYLAGIELLGGIDPVQRILGLRNDDRWRRPILLGLEQVVLSSLDVPYRLLSRLVEEPGRHPTQWAFDLLLAQEIAADLGWGWLEQRDSLFTGLKRRLAQAMAEVLGEVSVPARDLVRIGAILAELGDPRPGVCDLTLAMVRFPAASVVLGISEDEQEEWFQAYLRDYPNVNRDDLKRYLRTLVNAPPVVLAPFDLARYPVTNAQYGRFIEAGGYDPAAPWWDDAARTWLIRDDGAAEGLKGWQGRERKDQPEFWDNETFGRIRPNCPVVGISWYEATAFCRWLTRYLNDGHEYRLPSEAEWEYATRGTTRRTYPWGNDALDPERASYDLTYGFTTLAVGCFPAGATPEGVLDLAGSVLEWTRSEYRAYPYDPADGREDGSDPAQKYFTLRGGSWVDHPIGLRAAYRALVTPDYHAQDVGFRLAQHPPRVKH